MEDLPGSIAWTAGILPGIAIFGWIKVEAGYPWKFSNLVCGCLLIGISAYMILLLSGWGVIGEMMHATGRLTNGQNDRLKLSIGLWTVIIPLIFGGVGVNVLSGWLMSKRPETPEKPRT